MNLPDVEPVEKTHASVRSPARRFLKASAHTHSKSPLLAITHALHRSAEVSVAILSRPIAIFFLLSIWAMGLAYGGPYTIHFVDIQYPYNAWYSVSAFGLAWSPVNLGTYTGINIFSLPSNSPYLAAEGLGVPAWASQFTLNAVALWLSGYGMYLLIREFSRGESQPFALFGSFFGGLFYMLNIVPAEVYYWDFIPLGPLFQAALPFQILLLVKGVRHVNRTHQLPGSIILASGALSVLTIGANEPLAASALLILAGFSLWGILSGGRSWVRQTEFVLVLAGVILMANAFWLVPEVALAVGSGASAIVGPSGLVASTSDYVAFTSRLSFLSAFELRGLQLGLLSSYYALYNTSGWFALAFLPLCLFQFLPLLALSRLARSSRGPVFAAAGLLLTGALLFVGYNAPGFFGGTSGALANPLVVAITRNTGNAFGPALSFAEALLIGFGTIILFTWHGQTAPRRISVTAATPCSTSVGRARPFYRKVVWVLPIFLILLLMVPYLIPSSTGYLIASDPYESRTAPPPYEFATADFVNSHAGSAYTLLAPGGFQEQNWTNYGGHGYDGYDILLSLIHTPVIYSEGGGLGGPTSAAIQQAYTDLDLGGGNVGFSNLLSTLDVKYVVIEGGLGGSYPWGVQVNDNVSRMVSFLNAQAGITLVASFGLNQIFENWQPLPRPIFAPADVMNHQNVLTNMTSEYYTSTTVLVSGASSPPVTPELTPTGGIVVQCSRAQQLAGLSSPGYPILYNVVPLGIPVISYPTLSVSFLTGAFTAVQFFVSSTNTSRVDPLEGLWASTWLYSTPSYNVGPNDGWYYSPNATTTIQINLGELFSSEETTLQQPYLQYLSIELWPTLGNNTIQAHTTPQTTRNLTMTVQSIEIGSPIYSGGAPGSTPVISAVPTSNFTSAFENAFNTQSSGSLASPLKPVKNGTGFSLSFVPSGPNSTLSYPGFPSAFNQIPLGINVTKYPYLVLNISTAPGTAVLFRVSNASEISIANWSKAWIAPVTEFPQVANGEYSSAETISVMIDLDQALEGSSSGVDSGSQSTLNYFFIQLVATYAGSGNVSATMSSMTLTSCVRLTTNSISIPLNLTSLTRVGPSASVPFDPTSEAFSSTALVGNLTALTATIVYKAQSIVDYLVQVSDTSTVTVVAFLQNYNTEWQLEDLKGVSAVVHFLIDGYANGWILTPAKDNQNISFQIVYEGQAPLTSGIVITGIGAAVGLGLGLVAVVRRFRRRLF